MKKKQKENFNLQLKRGFIAVTLGLLLSISSPQLMYAKNTITPQLTEDVRVLIDREKQLFSARMNTDWEKMHSFQHPDFRKKISVAEMRYLKGGRRQIIEKRQNRMRIFQVLMFLMWII